MSRRGSWGNPPHARKSIGNCCAGKCILYRVLVESPCFNAQARLLIGDLHIIKHALMAGSNYMVASTSILELEQTRRQPVN